MEALRSGGEAWPPLSVCLAGPQPYRASRCRALARRGDPAAAACLSRLARSADDACVLAVDDRGRAALDKVLATLHAERQKVEGWRRRGSARAGR